MNTKKVIKLISGIFSVHWYRVIRLEIIKTQTRKFKQSALRKQYWIESYMDERGKPKFHVYKKQFIKRGIVKNIIQISNNFNTLVQAERFIFKATDKELNSILAIKEKMKRNEK